MSKAKKSTIRSDLAKAKGLGSAHEGMHHWLHQRITAVALLFLISWLVVSILSLVGASYAEFIAWQAKPFNAIAMILVVITSFYHAALGNQVVVEDYIHCGWFKTMKLIGMKLFFFAAAVACIFSICKIAFVG